MNQTFEQRIQSIEDQLKEIHKELEESLALYKQREYPFTNGDTSKFRSGSIGDIPEYEIGTHYLKGSIVKWVDGVEMEAKCDTVGSTSDWYEPTKYNEYGYLLENK